MCAGIAGFDWLLIDGEHAPNDLRSILGQLQAIAPSASHPIARIPVGHGHIGTTLVKQYLDLGVQTLLVPMVDTPEQAADLVRATLSAARHSRHGPAHGLLAGAATRRMCMTPMRRFACWCRPKPRCRCATSTRDCRHRRGGRRVYRPSADLSASMGHIGNPGHPDVQAAIADAIARIVKAGKAAGILTPDEALARHYLKLGATFVAVGLDISLLAQTTSAGGTFQKHGDRGLRPARPTEARKADA